MANPHPYVANNSFLGTCRPHANFLPDWSDYIFSAKIISVGAVMAKPHSLPCPHVFNDTLQILREHMPISAFLVAMFGRDGYTHTTNIYTCL